MCGPVGRPGDDRLSRVLRRSTIGAGGFHGRVRNGIGCWDLRYDHQVVQPDQQDATHMNGASRGSVVCVRIGSEILRPSSRRLVLKRLGTARGGERDQANRAIRTGQLNTLLCFHTRPINVVVFHGSSGRPGFEVGFPLRCIQRLSRPYIATRRCGGRHNRYTRGTSIPVLSY